MSKKGKYFLYGLLGLAIVGTLLAPEPNETNNNVEQKKPQQQTQEVVKDKEPAPVKKESEPPSNTTEHKEKTIPEIQDNEAVQTGTLAEQSEDWIFIVNNAKRTADEYAMKNNPSSSFVGNVSTSFDKQFGGEHEGRHLLTLVNNQSNGNVSYAQLLPLFDENKSVDGLDDEKPQWKVVIAKFNGQKY